MNTGSDNGSRKPRHASVRTVPAEAGLVVVSLSVVFGFSRLFVDLSFLAPLLVLVLAIHFLTAMARRLGLGVGISSLAIAATWILLTTWLWFHHTTRWLLPGPATIDAFRVEMTNMASAFVDLDAPVPTLTGFVIAASLAMTLAIFLADWAAFRLESPLESLVPLLTIFVFTTVLTADQHRAASAITFAGSTTGFLLLHRAYTTDIGVRSRTRMLTAGGVICSTAVIIGALAGPNMPGVGETALYDWRDTGSRESARVTVSPLVDIRSRLVDQSDIEVFTVETREKSYWRLTSLDTFDGSIWRSGGKYSSASGDLDHDNSIQDGADRRISQKMTITGLDALWLPAAFQPVAIDPGDTPVRFQAESSTLIVDSSIENSDGIQYTVESVLAEHEPDELRSATSASVPDEIRQRYAQMPDGLSEDALETARVVTAGSKGIPYDETRALQDFFRNNFTYDLTVPAGHGDNAIDEFLEARRGYCEQFAGTFAALARSLGIPARVAVGFTWGDRDPTNPDRYVVKGRHAHAWPEVYLAGFGWVPFEPTPGRGMPGADQWTGTTEAQEATSATVPPTQRTDQTGVPTSLETGGEDPTDRPPTDPGSTGATSTTSGPSANPTTDGETGSRELWPWVILVVFVGVLLSVTVVPFISKHRRRRRRSDAGSDNAALVRLAWLETTESLRMLGVVRMDDETHEEFATRSGLTLHDVAVELLQLAHDADLATFADAMVDETTVERSEATAVVIHEFARAHAPRLRLVAEYFRL